MPNKRRFQSGDLASIITSSSFSSAFILECGDLSPLFDPAGHSYYHKAATSRRTPKFVLSTVRIQEKQLHFLLLDNRGLSTDTSDDFNDAPIFHKRLIVFIYSYVFPLWPLWKSYSRNPFPN